MTAINPTRLIAIGVQLVGIQALWIAYSFVHRESSSIARMAFMLGSAIWFVIVVILASFEFYWFTWLTGLAICAGAFLWTHRNITHKSAPYHSTSLQLERMRALQNSQLHAHYRQ